MTHYSSQLANALADENEVTLIAPTHIDKKYFSKKINFKLINAPTSIIPSLFQILNIFTFLDIISFIESYNPHTIHFLNTHPLNNLIIHATRYKTVLTCHDPIQHSGDKNKFIMYLFKLNALWQLKRVDRIVVHGKDLAKDLTRQNIMSEKIVCMPIGDFAFFTNFLKSEIKEDNSILFFGRIKPYKGIKYLIEAESIMSKKISDYKIVIAGEGNITPYEKDVKNNPKFVIINEYISDSDVAVLFQKASIVVLPYVEATQSGIIPIAYAFKKPVVVTNVGSIPEVVEDGLTGFIVPPRNSELLANAIIKILKNDSLRIQMGENAYRKMKDELSWDKIAGKTVEVYENIFRDYK